MTKQSLRVIKPNMTAKLTKSIRPWGRRTTWNYTHNFAGDSFASATSVGRIYNTYYNVHLRSAFLASLRIFFFRQKEIALPFLLFWKMDECIHPNNILVSVKRKQYVNSVSCIFNGMNLAMEKVQINWRSHSYYAEMIKLPFKLTFYRYTTEFNVLYKEILL